MLYHLYSESCTELYTVVYGQPKHGNDALSFALASRSRPSASPPCAVSASHASGSGSLMFIPQKREKTTRLQYRIRYTTLVVYCMMVRLRDTSHARRRLRLQCYM